MIRIERQAGGSYLLLADLWVPRPLGDVFPFFADAGNLELLTPPWLNFKILTPMPVTMREGLLIDYRIALHGIPMRWQSEISAWDPPHRFVDEQRKGPYRVWHHTHVFEERDGGTLCADRVEYRVFGGGPVNRLFVGPRVRKIFEYRRARMLELFPPV
jgi:hypothetical protein